MTLKYLTFLITCVILASCNKSEKISSSTNNDFINQDIVNSLKTQEDHSKYLTNLFSFDQGLRDPVKKVNILKSTGYNLDSDEYLSYIKNMSQGDSISFLLTKKYLKEFGFPKFQFDNYKAKSAIITVTLHQDYENQEILFPYILEAYKTGYIKENRFSFLVNRMYAFKYGERFTPKKDLTEEENINQILKHLKKPIQPNFN